MNRATGVGLSVGIASVGLTCLVTDPTNLPGLIDGFKNAVPILVPVAKAIVAFPLVFHTVGGSHKFFVGFVLFRFVPFSGIRHLILDKTASGYSLQAFRASSLAVLAVAAVGTVFLASVTIEERQ
jgi:succinate dehydrogenase/fumarate reductase cytochrome b subunit